MNRPSTFVAASLLLPEKDVLFLLLQCRLNVFDEAQFRQSFKHGCLNVAFNSHTFSGARASQLSYLHETGTSEEVLDFFADGGQ